MSCVSALVNGKGDAEIVVATSMKIVSVDSIYNSAERTSESKYVNSFDAF